MWGRKYALRKATVMRTRILSVTPLNPLGVTAPLVNKGSQENGVNAMPCRRYNPSVKTCGFASFPYTVGFRAPPVADTARKASRCRPQVRERIAEARAANGEGAEKCAPSHLLSTAAEPRFTRQKFALRLPFGKKRSRGCRRFAAQFKKSKAY